MKNFAVNLIFRIGGLLLAAGLVFWVIFLQNQPLVGIILGGMLLLPLTYNLYQYVVNVNRKLVRFFESVRYADFTVKFKADDQRGHTFRDLNLQLNEVLEAFRAARAEKEANLQYLNTIVQQIATGLVSFAADGRVELVNNAALKMLGVYRIRQLDDLQEYHPQLCALLKKSKSAIKQLYLTPTEVPLSVQVTYIQLRGKEVQILVMQNIESELQEKEVEAWQNLTKVLRHEIMNSLTPILSLTATMKEIVKYDITTQLPQSEALEDLTEALDTLQKRSTGIIQFVNAYRDFTTLPKPVFAEILLEPLFQRVGQLFQVDFAGANITFKQIVKTENLTIWADDGQIEQVLINLLKNAMEAVKGQNHPKINLTAWQATDQHIYVEVTDNGTGISPEAAERIFIPFYTTKKTGSGIGLSLSRQIVQQHGGQLTVQSSPEHGTTFRLRF